MSLDQTLGAAPDPTYDPQSIVTGLIGQQAPDLVQNGTVDPQAVLNRLIRKGLAQNSSAQNAPADFSSFGKTKDELGDNAAPNGETPDFASFGQTAAEASAPNPDYTGGGKGTAESPYTGDVAAQEAPESGPVGAAQAAAASSVKMTGQTMKMAARGLPAMEQAEQGAFSPLNETLLTNPPKAEDQGLYKTGEAVNQFGNELGPSEATQKAHPIWTTFGSGVGAVVPGLAMGAIDPFVGIAGTAAMFGASSAEDTYEAAKKHGADDQTATDAAMLSGAANAALGSLPISNVLKPFARFMPQAAGIGVRILAQAAQNGVVFASVGEAQEYLGQQIAKMYDPKAGYSPDLERVIADFAAGAALGGLHAGFAGRGEPAETAAQPSKTAEQTQPNAGSLPAPGEAGAAAETGAGPQPQPGTGGAGAQQHPGFSTFTANGETFHTDNFTGDTYRENPQTGDWEWYSSGGQWSGPGGAGAQQAGPRAHEAPPPFETQLNPKTRAKLEEKASYYKEFSPEIIASWSDDKLKGYVNTKFGFGSQRADDDEVLRRYGLTPEDVAGMSPEQKSAAVDEAVRNGVHAGQAPPPQGTADNPVDLNTGEDVAAAAAMASQDHTHAQGEAGNAQRGHATWDPAGDGNGLNLSIEVPPGGVRKGTVPGTGEPWETTHQDAYGEILGVPNAADGMRPDVIVGPHPDAPNAYVIDEQDRYTGKYKQSKALVGFLSPEEAQASYLGISSKTPEQIAGIEAFPSAEFPKLVRDGLLSGPVAGKGNKADVYNVANETGTPGGESPTETKEVSEPLPPTPADHQAIENALRAVGVDPKHIRPVDLQRSAEIHAQEGYSPEDSFQLAVARAAVEDGLLTPEQVEQNYGPEIASLAANGAPEQWLRAQAQRTSTGGPAAAGANERVPGGGENGGQAGVGGEAAAPAAPAESAQPEKPAGASVAGPAGEAAATGHPAAGTPHLQRGAGGERNAERERGPARGEAAHQPQAPAAAGAPLIGDRVESLPAHKVTAADGTSVQVVPVVLDAAKLITSSDTGYDTDLQPRQRERAASQAQIREIATRLDPERLGYSAEADRGAPIVGPDHMVESGNGRVQAIRAVYSSNPTNAKRYKDWLKAQGVDVSKYKEPILVRQRVTDLDQDERKAFTVAANQAATLSMSAAERALADAGEITPHMLDLLAPDSDLNSLENRKFVRAFAGALPATERGALSTAEGGLSAEGLSRVRNAILAKAYGDPDIVSRITESTDDDVKSISNALVASAPAWAKLKSDIEAGSVPEEFDLTANLMEAVKRTADMRGNGQKLEEYLAQADAFDHIQPNVDGFIRAFYDRNTKRAVSAHRIAEFLRFYANEAAKVSADAGLDLGVPKVKPNEIVQTAAEKTAPPSGGSVREGGKAPRNANQPAGSGNRSRLAAAKKFGRSKFGGHKLGEPADLFGAEPGADNRPQLVIPGAEQRPSAELAKRRAAEPLRPRVAQKPLESGLFGEEHKQAELFAGTKPAQEKAAAPAGGQPEAAEAWWKSGLTPMGRELVAKAAGLGDREAKMTWRYLSDDERTKITAVRGTDKDPDIMAAAPTWAEVLHALPKDEKGRPNLTLAADLMHEISGKRQPSYRDLTPSQQTEMLRRAREAATPTAPQKWAEIGKNAEGRTLFEDARGVRSYVENGVRVTEPVPIVPTRAGVETVRPAHKEEWQIASERTRAESEPTENDYNDWRSAVVDGLEKVKAGEPIDADTRELLEDGDEDDRPLIKAVTLASEPFLTAHGEKWLEEAKKVNNAAPSLTGAAPTPTSKAGASHGAAGRPTAEAPEAAQPTMVRGAKAAVPEGGASRGVRRTGARRQPAQPSLFDWTGGERPLPYDSRPPANEPGNTEPPVPPEGAAVTKPPRDGKRVRNERRGAPGASRGLAEAQEKIAERSRLNYRITDDDHLGEGGPKTKVRDNLEAIRVLKALEDEKRLPTPEEKSRLVKYTGWGAFAQDMFKDKKPEWKAEREALKGLLTPEEYDAAQASTVNAHYTSPEVIKGIWSALDGLGFDGGYALEPSAGIGHFIGLVPDKVAPKTAWTAVELDPVTGKIAQALYGGAEVNIGGFEDLNRPANYYDLAISNVPFGNYPITRRPYGSHSIHDFFFVKALDKTRPGGVVAFITSRYTMDKQDPAIRKLLAQSADLVGAIRLPGGKKGAFAKNAGTEVTSDIIFLRKKVRGEAPFTDAQGNVPKWMDLKTVQTPDGPVQINEYFADRPNAMLGKMRLTGTMYGKNEPVLEPIEEAKPGDLAHLIPLTAMLHMSPAFLPRGTPPPPEEIPAFDVKGSVKDGAFFVKDGKVFQRRAGSGYEQKLSADDADRVSRLVGMRDHVNDVLAAQLANNKEDAEAGRAKLRKAYDAFVRKHGPINRIETTITKRLTKTGEPVVIERMPNFDKFREDPDSYKVAAIEDYDRATDTAKRAAIQERDVIAPPEGRDVRSPADALAASLDETGNVDLDHIANSLGLPSQEAAAHALGDLAYLDPDGRQWRTADDYLSGDVVRKLEDARAIAAQDPTFQRNVDALEKAQPKPLTRMDITARMGAPWVPEDVYEQFAREELGANSATVKLVPVTGAYRAATAGVSRDAASKYETRDFSPEQIFRAALNNKQLTAYDRDAEGKSTVNAERTEEARIKTRLMREAFAGDMEKGLVGWVFKDNERAERLEAIYNRTNNDLVGRTFDGSHLTLPGLDPMFRGWKHRKDAIWRIIQRGNTLLAHEVGLGKTVTMIGAGMEMKRLGLIRKPAYVVPNHMLEQFSREFIQAYPNAKVLVASKEETSRENRRAFLAKVVANDWDGVVITHDAFGRINMGIEWRKDFIKQQLDELERVMEAEGGERGSKDTIKALETAKKRLQDRLLKLMAQERKDEGVSFEESGVDHIFVDEAHKYKNLQLITRMSNVKGLSTSASQRAEDLFLKIRYLEQKRPGRSAVFATGTPVSNTMAELWTMQRYLQLDALRQRGLDTFDGWASTYGDTVTRPELSGDGRSLKDVTSFSKFVNIPELMALYSDIADYKTAEMVGAVQRPEIVRPDGTPGITIVESEPSPEEDAFIDGLVKRAEQGFGRPKKGEPNYLSAVITPGRKVALDGRLISDAFEFNPRGKIANLVDNVHREWKEGNEPGLAQLIFLDMGTPQSGARAPTHAADEFDEAAEERDPTQNEKPRIDLYSDIKRRLVDRGIPPKQIAFIHDANSDTKKGRLFEKVRAGEVRVLIGSSEKMGVGTNVQKLLIAGHQVDPPYKPAEVNQRSGRWKRQGNLNKKVREYHYVTRRSFDGFMWQTLERKAKFLTQIMSGAAGKRIAEDVDSPLPSAAELKAAASGDPRIFQFAELQRETNQLLAQKRLFEESRLHSNQQARSAQSNIDLYAKDLPKAEADAGQVQDLRGDKFKMTVGEQEFTDRAKAGQEIFQRVAKIDAPDLYAPKNIRIGTISGFDAHLRVSAQRSWGNGGKMTVELRGMPSLSGKQSDHGLPRVYYAASDVWIPQDLVGADPNALIRRYENILGQIAGEPLRLERSIAEEKKNLVRLKEVQSATWPKEAELEDKARQLKTLEAELKRKAADQAKSSAGMPSLEASSGETGGASANSSIEAPPGTQPSPGFQVSTIPEPFGSSTQRETPPSIFPAARTLRFSGVIGDIDPASKKYILQGSNDIKALRQAAEENKPEIERRLNEIAAEVPGTRLYGARVKDLPGLIGKVEAKSRAPNTISDYLGARVVADSPEAMEEFARRLHETGGVIEAENFLGSGKDGYRAYHFQVGLGDGTSAEIQLVPKPIADVMNEAHAARQPVKRIADSGGQISLEEQARAKAAMAKARAFFDGAWESAPEWRQHEFGEPERYFAERSGGLEPITPRGTSGAPSDSGAIETLYRGAALGGKAQDYVLARGRETGDEHLIALDQKGGIVGRVRGTAKSVSYAGTDLVSRFGDPENSIVVHHNHPKDSTLSDMDIAQLGLLGIHSIWAHGHGGRVSRAALTPFGRSLMDRDGDHNFRAFHHLIRSTVNRFLDPLQGLVDRRLIAPFRANDLLAYLANETLRRAGLIDYHTNDRFEDEVASLGLDPLVDSVTRDVQRSIPNGYARAATPGNDGRTGRLYRHPGDMGTSFGGGEEAPGRYDEQAGTDRQRGGGYRGQEAQGQQLTLLEGAHELHEPSNRFQQPTPPRAATPLPPTPPRPITAAISNTSVAKRFKNFWASTFQPELFSDRALEADPLFARYKSRQSQEKDAVIAQSENEWSYWNKRPDSERIRFLDDIETGTPPADPTQRGMARRYRAMLDKNWELEKQYGSQAAFVEDYLPHIWERPEEFQAWAQTRSAQVGPNWFQKKRTFDYIKEGLAAGLKLKYTNPVDLVVHRLLSGVDMRQRMDLLHRLKEMGLAWEGRQGGDQLVKRGWRAINAPDRKQWVLAPDVQLLWKNAVEAKGLWQDEGMAGGVFRGWMTIKNAWVPIKLALSAFHPLHVLHIDQANTLALAWDDIAKGHNLDAALRHAAEGVGTLPTLGMIHYRRGAEARAAWQKRPSQQTPEEKAIVESMAEGGFVPQLSEQLKISAKRQLAEAWQKIQRGEAGVSDWRRAVSAAMRRPIEKLQAPIFEKWIPALKTAAYLAQDAELMRRHPEYLDDPVRRRIARRAIAKSIDNRYGEMNYGTLFWNRYAKDSAIGSFLSLGWNLGFVREFGGAAMEAVSRPAGLLEPFAPSEGRKIAREATNKIPFVLAYVGTAALINGLMSYLFTGEEPHGLDFIFARIGGQNPDGSPRRVTNMFYLREIPMLLKHIQEHGGNVLSGAKEMLWNKLMFEPFSELLNNRNFYGYNVWDENAPLYKKVWQAIKHTYGDQFNPMSISGAKHAAQLSGKQWPSVAGATDKGALLSYLGFGPAPAYVEKSAIQNRIAYLYDQHVAPVSRPEEQGENVEDKLAVRQAILIARRDHDSKALSQAYAQGKAAGLSPAYMNRIGRENTDVYLFSRLPNEDQKAILLQADRSELNRYWPKAHAAVKAQMSQQVHLPGPAQLQ